MRSAEKNVSPKSELFYHKPSEEAESMYFLVQSVGHYYYEPDYTLTRKPMDSFLLMFVLQGSLEIRYNDIHRTAEKNHFVLLDCRYPHLLRAPEKAEAIWLQFYGQNSQEFGRSILRQLDFIFEMDDPFPIISMISRIFEILKHDHLTHDVQLSRYIYDILCDLKQFAEVTGHPLQYRNSTDTVIAYIDSHFKEDPDLQTLSEIAMVSPYHLLRMFRRDTGMTPHEYCLNLKIRTAKYMLKKTRQSMREVALDCGFSGESVFSTTFKRLTGMTPSDYRKNGQDT
ncbi:MAG: helix-turn-helix domain-containing protein [Lachnospiraceae bacterium]|nr:helix-turn-helix domain-containing protein [Lachnospiraceae bacterium]